MPEKLQSVKSALGEIKRVSEKSSLDQRDFERFKKIIENWFYNLKMREMDDTTKAAFKEGRLTVRLAAFRDELRTVKLGTATKMETKIEIDNSIQTMMYFLGLQKNSGEKNKLSLFQRAQESSFSRKHKYEIGLHAKGAILLVNGQSIKKQMKYTKARAGAIFMPVPPEDDHKVMKELGDLDNMLKREKRNPEIRAVVAFVRQRVTRLHQAHTGDGHNFYYLDRAPGTEGKDDPGKIAYRHDTIRTVVERRENTLKFVNLKIKNDGYREVIVKYRPHAGPFPLITSQIFDSQTKTWAEEREYRSRNAKDTRLRTISINGETGFARNTG